MGITNVNNSVHVHLHDDGVLTDWHGAEPVDVDKHLIIQEREVSYRLTLHQHPYVGQLMQRLLSRDTPALLAADTEFAPGNAARPDSVVFALGSDVIVTIPAEARGALIADVTATAGGGPLPLARSTTFKIGQTPATQARASAIPPAALRLEATLLGGLAEMPAPGSSFVLPDGSTAIVRGNTLLKLEGPAQIVLTGGATAILPAGTELALADGAVILVPSGASATLLRGRRLPLLFAPALAAYQPSALVAQPRPAKELDFSYGGAYSIYNWELFFHVPLTIAIHLMKNGRYAEAQRWFHTLFDPTDNSDGPTPERFWKVLPFQTTDVKKVEEILVNLATGADAELREETIRTLNAWKDSPFQPHAIARGRQGAYMVKTVMAYLDNLIAWGDSLFRQDTGEAIDEALMLYVLAANILGPRPQAIPPKGSIRPQTYRNLREDLKHFGTVVREMEADVPFELAPLPSEDAGDTNSLATLRGLGRALYFCVPRNDRLLGYWGGVADRLFKIRNSLNIQGIFRQLALFEPPIDPALLVRATAAGLDVSAIVNGLNQPLPLVRFLLLAQKANEIAQEVKSLGNSLLSAMEKEDGEAMAILRARHERAVMEMVEHVRYGQHQEAIKSREGLLASLALAVQRYTYYERQLGKKADEIETAIPELVELDQDRFDRMKFASKEPEMALREIEVDIDQDLGESGGRIVSSHEAEELRKSGRARDIQDAVRGLQLTAQGFALLPDVFVDAHFWGIGGTIETAGGKKFADFAKFTADSFLAYADHLSHEAGQAAKIGSYARREQDWTFQSNLAAGEISQIFKQLRAAQIREAIAEQELKSHRLQMKQAEEIEFFLNQEGTQPAGKKTNRAFYAFEKREVRGLYAQCFQLAFDVARKAERALQHELGDPTLTYLQFGYLAGKEGLLAGEKLYLDIKRMEMAYLELNQREYELTRHVSLLQVDPLALLRLRATGRCTVRLPEELFDMDGPGHYFRRIKSVAVSIPCVTGPFASVNCKLTLLKSSIRVTPVIDGDYAREDAEDTRFNDYFGSLQSIVTSSAQNDSGMFETNLRDERYLPFENSGVVSEWLLELPADVRQFDYDTISDVILHIRYTAREGGGLLRKGAVDNLTAAIEASQAAGSIRLFSVRHEFPSEWAKFLGQVPGAGDRNELAIKLRQAHYPFWSQGRLKSVTRVDILARSTEDSAPTSLDVFDKASGLPPATKKDTLNKDPALGDLLVGKLTSGETGIALPKPEGELKLIFAGKAISDLWIAVTWSSK
jgi:hypothetical protein